MKKLITLLLNKHVQQLLVALVSFSPVSLVIALNYTGTAYALPLSIGMGVVLMLVGAQLVSKSGTSMKDLRDCLIRFDYIDEDTTDEDVMAYAVNAIEDGEEQIKNQLEQMASAVNKQADDLENAIALTNQGVSHQKTETEKLIQSMEEMLAAASSVSANAQDASVAANDAESNAHQGQQVLTEATEAINNLANQVETSSTVIKKLAEDSENIGTILDVIKGIAEQTNLLALNAAIEAARAGEQGRGFAVVADEVRSLASRTHESTQEIEEMIHQLQSAAQTAVESMSGGHAIAQSSVEQVGQANDALGSITAAIERIRGMNTQIASAAEQQSAATQEIKNNVEVIDEVSELTVDTLQGLNSISNELQTLVKSMQAAQMSLTH